MVKIDPDPRQKGKDISNFEVRISNLKSKTLWERLYAAISWIRGQECYENNRVIRVIRAKKINRDLGLRILGPEVQRAKGPKGFLRAQKT